MCNSKTLATNLIKNCLEFYGSLNRMGRLHNLFGINYFG